jgi:putative transposase
VRTLDCDALSASPAVVSARYTVRLIESEGHALEVCRYVPLNPVKSGLCPRPEQWFWSSYAVTIGLREDTLTDSGWILDRFGGELFTARQTLRDFVEAGLVSETVQGT